MRKKSKATVVLSRISDTLRFGQVTLGEHDTIQEFQEKTPGNGPGFVNAGIYLINKSFIAKIPQRRKLSIEKDIFPKWIRKQCYGYTSNNRFIDIGTPESLTQAERFFATYRL